MDHSKQKTKNQLESDTFQRSARSSTRALDMGDIPTCVKYTEKINSGLYVFSEYRNELTQVYKKDYERRNWPVIVIAELPIKFKGSRDRVKFILNKVVNPKNGFVKETLVDEVKTALSNAKYKYDNVRATTSNFVNGVSTIFNIVTQCGAISTNVENRYRDAVKMVTGNAPVLNSKLLTQYIKPIMKIMVIVGRLASRAKFDMLDFVEMAIILHDFVEGAASFFVKESLETVLIAGISCILPPQLVAILKRMQVYTSKKIFDDGNILVDLLNCISQLITFCVDRLPTGLKSKCEGVLDLFGVQEFIILHKLRELLKEKAKDKYCILSQSFRNKVFEAKALIDNLEGAKYLRKNKQYDNILQDFIRLHKTVKSYIESSRQEPCCFIFEGPPGSRKSVTMNKVVRVLGLPHYAHTVKSSEDGKDWYDMYDNEDIFYMDDVGQMGKSQWRNLINWVSCVKLPLDCADASLKDTKFFNSDLILLTTNNFKNLGGFTSKDCIDNPEALWRRGFVFNFDDIKILPNNKMEGVAKFEYYDIVKKQFVNAFPADFEEYMKENTAELIPVCNTNNQIDMLVWITSIINGFKDMRSKHQISNVVEEVDIDEIRRRVLFKKQAIDDDDGIHLFDDGYSNYESYSVWDSFKAYLDRCMQLLIRFAKDTYTLAASEPYNYVFIVGIPLIFVCMAMCCPEPPRPEFDANEFVYFDLKEWERTGVLDLKPMPCQQEGAFISKLSSGSSEMYDQYKVVSTPHTLATKASQQVFEVDIRFTERGSMKTSSCFGLWTGRLIIVPYHLVLDHKIQLTVYKDKKKNYKILDNSLVDIIYTNTFNDIAILKVSDGYPTPFPKLDKCFQPAKSNPNALAFPHKLISLEGLLSSDQQIPISYIIREDKDNREEITVNKPLIYDDLHYAGMCGVPVVTATGQIVGMHVAGSESCNKGAALLWDDACRLEIGEIVNAVDKGLKLEVGINAKMQEDCSGLKIDTGLSKYVPKNSNFVKSPLYQAFDTTRFPANLTITGPHTVKDIAKAARGEVGFVDHFELDFAQQLIDMYMTDYGDVPDEVVINGDLDLAPMNKKSSNGIFPLRTKEECFDYENGKFTEEFKPLMKAFIDKMSCGSVSCEDIAWFETLKDELRGVEKLSPRSFRVSPVTMQVLTKKCFGNLARHLVDQRWFNQIMIGINPFTEWGKLYDCINRGKMWAGDIGKYDKNMKVQVQLMIARVLLKHYTGEYQQAARNLLENLAYSLVVVNDDSWVLTHSLPSGCWLTAIFNSLVNRAYTAMWYYREMNKAGYKPNIYDFHTHVSDPVYGDDRINCCKVEKFEGFLNAITMADFFESLGMTMTTSVKGKITTPFQHISEITFLKRQFVFHPILQVVTCPLDLRTLYSSLSWIDSSKEDPHVVMQDKISAFQREIFLHYDLYSSRVEMLAAVCKERGVPFVKLPVNYLVQLYNTGAYDDEYAKAYGMLK